MMDFTFSQKDNVDINGNAVISSKKRKEKKKKKKLENIGGLLKLSSRCCRPSITRGSWPRLPRVDISFFAALLPSSLSSCFLLSLSFWGVSSTDEKTNQFTHAWDVHRSSISA